MPSAYTKVPKPTTAGYTKVAKPQDQLTIRKGMISGLLIPLTYAITQQGTTNWTKIGKPTGSTWSTVSKPIT